MNNLIINRFIAHELQALFVAPKPQNSVVQSILDSNFQVLLPDVAASHPYSVGDCFEDVAKNPAFKSCKFFVGKVLWEDCVDFV
jgi:hypothetical protein